MATSPAPRDRPIPDSAITGDKRAVRFFWAVLMLATGASVAGNVTHAVLDAATGNVVVAAAAAVVPPTVLLGATHSVALLVRTRAGSGFTYWSALSMTLALTLCAFVLSFDALRALAITAGIDTTLAWLWPLVIDLSIAQATMALLALTGRHHRSTDPGTVNHHPLASTSRLTPSRARTAASATPGHHRAEHYGSPTTQPPTERTTMTTEAGPSTNAHLITDRAAAESHWRNVADILVRERRTKIQPAVVAKVLAMTATRIPPSTIGRRLNVHHTSVRRIQQAAAELTS